MMEITPPGKVEAVVFDLDGTLIDSTPGIGSALSSAFRSIGREMPAADLRKAIGPPIQAIAKRLEPGLTGDELQGIERVYRAGYDSEGWRETVLFDGALATLQALRNRGLRLFIVTNKPGTPTGKILAHLEMAGLFEAVLTRDSRVPAYSSKSEMLSTLLQSCLLQKEFTIMVGDTPEDEEAAASNRVRFIFANYGYGSLPSAETSIDRLDGLTGIVL